MYLFYEIQKTTYQFMKIVQFLSEFFLLIQDLELSLIYQNIFWIMNLVVV